MLYDTHHPKKPHTISVRRDTHSVKKSIVWLTHSFRQLANTNSAPLMGHYHVRQQGYQDKKVCFKASENHILGRIVNTYLVNYDTFVNEHLRLKCEELATTQDRMTVVSNAGMKNVPPWE